MINNMFSIFDPSTSTSSSGWLIIIVPLIMMNSSPINKSSKPWNCLLTFLSFVQNEVNQLISNNFNLTSATFLALFSCLLLINFNAIFPFNFTPTAHISISLTVSISIWLSTIIFGWNNQANNIIIHLTPLGTPNPLINFIVIIEIISSMIRPITLSIRLSANIVAGHLLMALLSSFSIGSSGYTITSSIPIISLITLEVAVALVQAYVFITLMILYQNETC